MSLSPQQLAQRKDGITATDIAAIAGLHPYRSAIDVFLDKTGRAPPFAGNDRTRWGNILEAPIRDDYAERHGVRVEVPGTLEHPEVTWAKATPDGICYAPRQVRPKNGLEIKTHSFRAADQYGDPGTDQVPPHELVQCVWNMFVSGLDNWDLVAFIDGQPAEYRIVRDDDLIELLRSDAERFLFDHVRKDVPPPPDGSESYDSYLSATYSQKRPDLVSIDAMPEALMLVRSLRVARDQLAQAETYVDTLAQSVKMVIGDGAGIEWSDPDAKKGKSCITYKVSQDGTATDWQAAWRSLVIEAQLALSVPIDPRKNIDELICDLQRLIESLRNIAKEKRSIDAYTTTVSGSRRFTCPRHWSKKNKEGT
jgi:putative phage-type endonuclease